MRDFESRVRRCFTEGAASTSVSGDPLLTNDEFDRMVAFAAAELGDRDEAISLIAFVLVRCAHPSSEGDRPIDRARNPGAYAWRAVKNGVRDQVVRERKHRRHWPTTPVHEQDCIGKGPGPDAIAEARETQALIDAAIRALPPDLAHIILLRFGEITWEEIAEACGTTARTASDRAKRAARKFLEGPD